MGYRLWAQTASDDRLVLQPWNSDCISYIQGWATILDCITEFLYDEPDSVAYYFWYNNPVDIGTIYETLVKKRNEINSLARRLDIPDLDWGDTLELVT